MYIRKYQKNISQREVFEYPIHFQMLLMALIMGIAEYSKPDN